MTYFIGGSYNGEKVATEELHKDEIADFGEKINSLQQKRKYYRRTKVSFHGTIKTFYILEGGKPIDHRDAILELWEDTPTDVYAI